MAVRRVGEVVALIVLTSMLAGLGNSATGPGGSPAESAAEPRKWPCRIIVHRPLLQVVEAAWEGSRTFRRLCGALAEKGAIAEDGPAVAGQSTGAENTKQPSSPGVSVEGPKSTASSLIADGAPSSRILISEPATGRAVREALREAWTQLEEPRCQTLLTAFSDRRGRPLAGNVPRGVGNLRTYLATLVFVDGSDTRSCAKGALAVTEPGSRVVRVCGSRLVWNWQQNPRHVVAGLIHEALHTLGLGENPPSSAEITSRVLRSCGAS